MVRLVRWDKFPTCPIIGRTSWKLVPLGRLRPDAGRGGDLDQRPRRRAALQVVEGPVHIRQPVAAGEERREVEPAGGDELAVARVVAVRGVVPAPGAQEPLALVEFARVDLQPLAVAGVADD